MGDIIAFDRRRRLSGRGIRLRNPSKEITFLSGTLPDRVLLRVILRQGKKEQDEINRYAGITKGDLSAIPSNDQIKAFYGEDGGEGFEY